MNIDGASIGWSYKQIYKWGDTRIRAHCDECSKHLSPGWAEEYLKINIDGASVTHTLQGTFGAKESHRIMLESFAFDIRIHCSDYQGRWPPGLAEVDTGLSSINTRTSSIWYKWRSNWIYKKHIQYVGWATLQYQGTTVYLPGNTCRGVMWWILR